VCPLQEDDEDMQMQMPPPPPPPPPPQDKEKDEDEEETDQPDADEEKEEQVRGERSRGELGGRRGMGTENRGEGLKEREPEGWRVLKMEGASEI
jgi:hypothetical protein